MADLSFDAVLIGGGSKGLVTGMYLAVYGGMKVGIFEDRVELGGGWCSEESPAPGFIAGKEGNWFQMDGVPAQSDCWAPIPEWSRNKIPEIEGLYTAARCFGGVGGGNCIEGYRCYRVMAEDFGLPIPGMKKGRPY